MSAAPNCRQEPSNVRKASCTMISRLSPCFLVRRQSQVQKGTFMERRP